MQPSEFEALVANIQDNGYDPMFPVIRYQGEILDGWHRYRASTQLKIKPPVEDFEGDDNAALMFAVRANGQRRNLTAGQLAYVACDLAPLFQESARERIRTKKKADPAPHGASSGKVSDQVARILGVSKSSVERMMLLRKEAPELADAVRIGPLTVFEAYNQHIANKRAAEAEQARLEELTRQRRENEEADRQRKISEKRAAEAERAERQRREADALARRQQEEAERKRRLAEESKSKAEAARLRREAEEAEERRKAARQEEEARKLEAERKRRESEKADEQSRLAAMNQEERKRREEERLWAAKDKEIHKLVVEMTSKDRAINILLTEYIDAGLVGRIPNTIQLLFEHVKGVCGQFNIPFNPEPAKKRKIIDV
jgi:hypothetical protein